MSAVADKYADLQKLGCEVISVSVDTPIESMIRLFQQRKLRCIPVLGRDGRLAGIVARKDILKYYARRLAVLE